MKKIIMPVILLGGMTQGFAQYHLSDGISPGAGATNPVAALLNPLHGNPAALQTDPGSAWMLAAAKPYNVGGLYSVKLAVGKPVGRLHMASHYERHGYRGFAEQQLGIWLSRSLGKHFHGGIKLLYLDRRFPTSARRRVPGWEIGLLGRILPKWTFGLHIVRQNSFSSAKGTGAGYASSFSQGLHWQAAPQLQLFLAGRISPETGATWSCGVVYRLDERTDLKLGLTGAPLQPGISIGYRLATQVVLDLGNRYHPFLGWSPAFTLSNRKIRQGT